MLIRVNDINNVRNRYRRACAAWKAYGWAPRYTFREFALYARKDSYSSFEGAYDQCVNIGKK